MATLTGDSPVAVAYALMLDILEAEKRAGGGKVLQHPKNTEEALLAPFGCCLVATRPVRPPPPA